MNSAGKNKSSSSSKKNGKKGGFRPKTPEYTVAALLLSGKLRVDSVQLYRNATMFVSLVGEYRTISSDANADKLLNFLNENGDLTINDIINAIKKKADSSS